MKIILEIESSGQPGASLSPGQEILVGRLEGEIRVPSDSRMSAKHFRISCTADGKCYVRDLNSSNGSFLNGNRIQQAMVINGDRILAGRTTFAIRVEQTSPAQDDAPRPLLRVLREEQEPLFAILDAARDRAVLGLLEESGEQFQSLYEGEKAADIAEYGPYLISLPKQSTALESLAQRAWGRNWAIFFNCPLPFEKVRHHFRQFLKLKLEDGQEVYFRFYDPRVLRSFLPTCDANQIAQIFGPVQHFLAEGGNMGTVLQFTRDANKLKAREIRVHSP